MYMACTARNAMRRLRSAVRLVTKSVLWRVVSFAMPERAGPANFFLILRLNLSLLIRLTGASMGCLLLLLDRKSLHHHACWSDLMQGDMPLSMCRTVFFGELKADDCFCDA